MGGISWAHMSSEGGDCSMEVLSIRRHSGEEEIYNIFISGEEEEVKY